VSSVTGVRLNQVEETGGVVGFGTPPKIIQ
jgi:hypothetical protein